MCYRERRYGSGLLRCYDFLWDADNRLKAVDQSGSPIWTACYNGSGLPVNKCDVWTGNHDYSWGPAGLVADSNSNTTYTPGFGQQQNGVDRCFAMDRLGSTRYTTDSTGNT